MSAVIMDGKTLGKKIQLSAAEKTAALKEKGIVPSLAVILVGNDPASLSYVVSKEKALADAGMESRDIRFSDDLTEDALLSIISDLNDNEKVHGILVQLPLPSHISEVKVVSAISPEKDVDCFHPVSVGKLISGESGFLPCTPHGVIKLLEEYNIPISGSHVVIVGRSNIVGKPLANLLISKKYNATVTICHTGTYDIAYHSRQADILIAAAGMPDLIKPDMIREDAVVVDVGVNRVLDISSKKGYSLRGDVSRDVAEKASFVSLVPGGVGPMTIAMLLQNVLKAAEDALERSSRNRRAENAGLPWR